MLDTTSLFAFSYFLIPNLVRIFSYFVVRDYGMHGFQLSEGTLCGPLEVNLLNLFREKYREVVQAQLTRFFILQRNSKEIKGFNLQRIHAFFTFHTFHPSLKLPPPWRPTADYEGQYCRAQPP